VHTEGAKPLLGRGEIFDVEPDHDSRRFLARSRDLAAVLDVDIDAPGLECSRSFSLTSKAVEYQRFSSAAFGELRRRAQTGARICSKGSRIFRSRGFPNRPRLMSDTTSNYLSWSCNWYFRAGLAQDGIEGHLVNVEPIIR
jgi:hypothetical protein